MLTITEAMVVSIPILSTGKTNGSMYAYTIPLNYNFICTHMNTRGNMEYFVCKMSKFPVEIIIFTRDVAFPRDEMWYFREMSRECFHRYNDARIKKGGLIYV